MDSPYTPPVASDVGVENLVRSKKFFGKAALICGVVTLIPPILGLIGIVIGMVGAFSELSKTGSANPSTLANQISFSLLTTLWGFVISVISLIPFSIFLFLFLKKRSELRKIANH